MYIRGANGVTTPLTSPRRGVGERRTYGLYRGRELLGVLVDELVIDSLDWAKLYRRGLMVFMLYEHDISLRPDCRQVMVALKDRYQEVMSK